MPQGNYAYHQANVPGDASLSPTNVVYTAVNAGGLNELDKIARFALAAAHSGQYAGTHREQHFISQRTVAVARYNGELFIAANDLWNDDVEDVGSTMQRVEHELRNQGIGGRIRFIPNRYGYRDRSCHAEVQIVNYFFSRAWRLYNDTIGVSKPCCLQCANKLDQVRILYSYWHDQNVGHNYIVAMPNRSWW
ncbi:hypothetical protein [Coleofasciculus sp.]|uniref:hypothetical protein n=1 Tax=Coleofasciculus sp. TaxID=3100458 RepID=UPI0039F7F3A5